jgi:choline dehydrogenase
VLLIEAGGEDDYHWIHIPVGYLYCIGNPRTDWLYQTEPDAGLNGRKLRYPRGKVLGGCSSINGMIYMRGQSRDYDQWAALTGDASWRWDQGAAGVSSSMRMARAQRPGADDFDPTAPAASGASSGSACAGTSSTPSRRPPSRPASRPATTSTAATTKGVGYFEVNQQKRLALERTKAFLRPVLRPAQPRDVDRSARTKLLFEPILPPAMAGRAAWACRSGPATAWSRCGSSGPAAK